MAGARVGAPHRGGLAGLDGAALVQQEAVPPRGVLRTWWRRRGHGISAVRIIRRPGARCWMNGVHRANFAENQNLATTRVLCRIFRRKWPSPGTFTVPLRITTCGCLG